MDIQPGESRRFVILRFLFLHLGSLGIFFVPMERSLVALFLATFFFRMLGVECGYHRYFSHKAYKTSRVFQFILAFWAQSSGQKGVLWWAMHHRHHHRYADTEKDIHSPLYKTFWGAHFSWVLENKNLDTDLSRIRDYAKYPELVFLNKYHYIPTISFLVLIYCIGEYSPLLPNVNGLQAVFWGFFLSTLTMYHITMTVNSVVHDKRFKGSRRFETNELSRNNAFLAIPLVGAAWHNNHHRYPSAGRAGFYWWEVDLSYYLLRVLQWLRVISDLTEVPKEVLDEGRKIHKQATLSSSMAARP
jgi:stearoyl-CoA desaturase (Delta-9 desaturase)